jgi:hypothetical protein
MNRFLAISSMILGAAGAASAQSDCSYERCALRIAPRWDGLAAVRGSGEEVTNLRFLLPRSILPSFSESVRAVTGSDSAIVYASRALDRRPVAAAFTDAGLLLAGGALVHAAARHEISRGDAILAGIGAGTFAISVPLQFAADDLLGKAVWWYNRRFVP